MVRRTNQQLWDAHQSPKKRGEGSVFYVKPSNGKPGFYRATRTVSWDPVKRRAIQVTGSGPTPAEAIARREANHTRALVRAGKLRPSQLPMSDADDARTFDVLLAEWLKWKRSQPVGDGGIRASTYDQYESLIRLHIAPSDLGQMPIRRIERQHVRQFLFEYLPGLTRRASVLDELGQIVGHTTLPQLGVSNRRAIQGIVNMALKYAQMEAGYLENNPANGVRPIPKGNYKGRAETLDKYKWVAKNLLFHTRGTPEELRWLLAITTGARQSEILSLTWDRFTYLKPDKANTGTKPNAPRVVFSHQLQRVDVGDKKKGWAIVEQVKTPSSHRIVPLDPRVVEVILFYRDNIQKNWMVAKDEKTNEKKWKPIPGLENLVFTLENGQPITATRDNKRYRDLLHRYRLPYVRQHTLRHFAASQMVANGTPIEHVAAMLGHGSTSITRAVYLHQEVEALVEPVRGLVDSMFRDRDRGYIEEWDENGPVPGQGAQSG